MQPKPNYYNRVYYRTYPFGHIFFELNDSYPNIIYIDNLNYALLKEYLQRYVWDWHRSIEYVDESKQTPEVQIFVRGKFVLAVEIYERAAQTSELTIYFPESERENISNLISTIRQYREVKQEARLNLLTAAQGELYLRAFSIPKPDMDLGLLYGEDFVPIYQKMYNRLSKQKDKGIVLLYGQPGTGKTTLIRYLISELSQQKEVIYLPPDMTRELASPNFIQFLMAHPESILIIEDAENVVKARNEQSHQAVANLLNLTDGLLSDCLGIQVVCSFNCELQKIDPALLRKGRLIAKHRFDKLNVEQVTRLRDSLNLEFEVKDAMTLAEIFYQHEQVHEQQPPPRIGFNAKE